MLNDLLISTLNGKQGERVLFICKEETDLEFQVGGLNLQPEFKHLPEMYGNMQLSTSLTPSCSPILPFISHSFLDLHQKYSE